MKVFKTLMIVLVAGALVATLIGCGSGADATTSSTQEYTVKKGDISLTITAAGNLALSQTQDLAVDLFYPAGTKGTIGSVLVEEGDSVKEGQVLATLDKDEWNDQLDSLQKTLTTAQRNVTTKDTAVTDAERQLATLQRTVSTKENDVTKKQRDVESKKLLVTSAELSVTSANNTLNQIADVKKAKDAVDYAELNLYIIKMLASGNIVGGLSDIQMQQFADQIGPAMVYLLEVQDEYDNIIRGTGVTTSTDVALLIAQKKYALDQANSALEDAKIAVDDAEAAVTTAQIAVDDANYAVTKQQQTLANARVDLDDATSTLADTQKKLTDAQAKSPEIKAPFDGFVTKINVEGGDEVLNGTVAVTVADPNRFEADILVSEMDIMKVSLGGDATISLNAITGVKLPAKITHIAPTATISSGVVNYVVKVEVDAEAASRLQSAGTSSAATTANTTGQLSAALQRMVDAGRITQEQAETMAQGGGLPEGFSPRAGITLPEGFTPPAGTESLTPSTSQAASQLPSTVTQNFQLKQGLTGTVDLIVAQKSNVLLVPNTALTKAGTQSSVQVVMADGTTEKRIVQVGLSDWQNTEITEGLTEGEKIIVPKGTTTTTTSSSSSQRAPGGGGIFFGR
jgi:multidrug efflux pump subunit AcrA (membrane-fusion protein)